MSHNGTSPASFVLVIGNANQRSNAVEARKVNIDAVSTFAADIAAGRANDRIGTSLELQNDRLRVWHLRLAPGQRLPFHRHDRPYFWTVLTDGKGRSRFDDGRVVDIVYRKGETKYFDLNPQNMFIHDLQNTGTEELLFVTVEFAPQA
jgi:quercetin dioxygenase-like cupin family protein